ncbi:hypothetical protein Gpo141_00008019 [Globisporangium polare]
MATPAFASLHHTPGEAYASSSNGCLFVGRRTPGDCMDDDDELLDDADDEIFRSTFMQPSVTLFASVDHQYNDSSMDVSPEFVPGAVTASTCHREVTNTQLVPKIEFSSIAEDYPLPVTSSASLASYRPDNTANYRSCSFEAAAGAQISNSQQGGDVSIRGRITPVMMPVQEEAETNAMTVPNRSSLLQSDPDNDRKSPFADTVLQLPKLYQYVATKTEEDDMEQLRWEIQESVFHRYFALQQREPQWGAVEERDARIFFHPGKRRAAIMIEKKFHDSTYQEGIADGDASWYKARRAQFAEVYREFCRDETKHKQEIMLTRLEKNSTFSKFPILGNRFLLVRLLGKGGNGEVWNVIDYADNKRSCALKLSTSVKHAQQEHLTHSKLNHPKIVDVGDTAYLIEYRQQCYTAFTVDSVETDLQQLIEMHGHFDEESALNILFQLLTSLSYLHNERKIAHYDLKPSNILVTKDVCVKLTDFDLARDVHEPISSSSVGTLRYLPPECYRPNFGDCQGTAEKADIWMVGIVFCLMLWGKHPICGEKSTIDEAKASIARYNGQLTYSQPVPDRSRWIIQGCLHPDPRCRPSASQLLQALQTIQHS